MDFPFPLLNSFCPGNDDTLIPTWPFAFGIILIVAAFFLLREPKQ